MPEAAPPPLSQLTALLQATRAQADNHRGVACQRQGQWRQAQACFQNALAWRPDYAEAQNNLALGWQRLGDGAAAEAGFRRAARLQPDDAALQATVAHNLGLLLHQQGRLAAAGRWLERALAVRPEQDAVRADLAIVRLLQGDYAAAWENFETRQRRAGESQAEHRRFDQPQWSGQPAAGRTLLLWGEQGLGDQIQLLRYVPLVLGLGWQVLLEVAGPLLALCRSIPGVTLLRRGAALPPFDLHCPLLSLPRAFATTPTTIPATVPYLGAEPARVAAWRARLPAAAWRIGVSWQGNPLARAEAGRSAPLASLAPLARLPGVRLISLQKQHGLEQLAALPPGMAVDSLGDDFDAGEDAFLDCAAVMMSLDLVVSVDSAVGHLAGALGRPTWLALQAVPHWVWMMERSDTPWYPHTRLFRQTRPGDWDGVFVAMAAALRGA
jgi:hypothetical protein